MNVIGDPLTLAIEVRAHDTYTDTAKSEGRNGGALMCSAVFIVNGKRMCRDNPSLHDTEADWAVTLERGFDPALWSEMPPITEPWMNLPGPRLLDFVYHYAFGWQEDNAWLRMAARIESYLFSKHADPHLRDVALVLVPQARDVRVVASLAPDYSQAGSVCWPNHIEDLTATAKWFSPVEEVVVSRQYLRSLYRDLTLWVESESGRLGGVVAEHGTAYRPWSNQNGSS